MARHIQMFGFFLDAWDAAVPLIYLYVPHFGRNSDKDLEIKKFLRYPYVPINTLSGCFL